MYGMRRCVWVGACRYEKPTPIQAQALPAALSGRDVLVSTTAVLYCCSFHLILLLYSTGCTA